MADSLHQVTIQSDDATLYQAITSKEGIQHWWTDQCEMAHQEGEPTKLWLDNGRTQYTMRSQKLLPNKRIFWVCTQGPEEWIGTELWWEINAIDSNNCQLDFKHMNWHRDDGLFPQCNSTWGKLMNQLKRYCESQD